MQGESTSTSKANFDQSLHGALPVGSILHRLWPLRSRRNLSGLGIRMTLTNGNSSQNLVDEENSTAFFVPE